MLKQIDRSILLKISVLLSFIKIRLQQEPLADEGRFAGEDRPGGDGSKDGGRDGSGAGGSVGGDGSRAEDESAGNCEGGGDTGGEEERLRRGGDQAHRQSHSDKALDDGIVTEYVTNILPNQKSK